MNDIRQQEPFYIIKSVIIAQKNSISSLFCVRSRYLKFLNKASLFLLSYCHAMMHNRRDDGSENPSKHDLCFTFL